MALVCGVEVSNLLDPASYLVCEETEVRVALRELNISGEEALDAYDISRVPHSEREGNVYSRGRAISLLKTCFSDIVVKDARGKVRDAWSFLWIPTFARFLHGLRTYYEKSSAASAAMGGEDTLPGFARFEKQLQWSAARWEECRDMLESLHVNSADGSSLFPWDDEFSVDVKTQRRLQGALCVVAFGVGTR